MSSNVKGRSKSKSSKQKTTKSKLAKRKTKPKASTSFRWRLLFVWTVLVLASFALGYRLFTLQVSEIKIEGKTLKEKARARQESVLRPFIPRRAIVDHHNNVLATDRLVYTLYVHPIQFNRPKEEMAKELALLIPGETPQKLLQQFNKRDTGIKLASDLSETVGEKIKKLRKKLTLNGLDIHQEYQRYYPYEYTFADVVGYLDFERQPQAGVELSQEKLLHRELTTLKIRRSGNGFFLPEDLPVKPFQADNLRLQLTLDLPLQQATHNALKATLAKYKAKRGAVIIMDVTDGSILALACQPTYNPNRFFAYDLALFKNWAVSDLYEPGSTFKPINVAIALEAGVIKPNSIFFDPGKLLIGKAIIKNHDYEDVGGNGNINVTQILERSSNIGMIKIMNLMKHQDFYRHLKQLGLGEKIDSDLPAVAQGQFISESDFRSNPLDPASTAFGQGFSLTPLQLVQLHGAIANGGKLVTPHVIKGLVDAEGKVHWQPRFSHKQVFPTKITTTVLSMMESVVKYGSGEAAQIPGYRIAGKTGTAQKATSTGKGYQVGAKITSFVSILPVESPRYVVLTIVDEPKGENTFGGTVAAPLAKSVMNALVVTQNLPPSGK